MSKKKKTIKKNSKQTYMEKKTAIASILRDRKTSPKKERKKVNLSLKQITVKNAEGDPDTTATILIQNQIDYVPKVSVIIPVYNVEQYLRECLDSVVNQTLKDIEIICVDDGSTDSSLEILKEYAQKDRRFTIIIQKNLHAGVARNAGLSQAKGEYLSFLDSDDWFELNMLEESYTKAIQDKSDVVIWRSREYDTQTGAYRDVVGPVSPQLFKHVDETNTVADFGEKLFQANSCVPWNKLISATLVNKLDIRYGNTLSSNDTIFIYGVLSLANKISLLNKVLVNYRVNNPSSLQRSKQKSWECVCIAFMGLKKLLEKRRVYEQQKRTFVNKTLQACLYYLKTVDDQTAMKMSCALVNKYFEILDIKDYGNGYIYNRNFYQRYKELMHQRYIPIVYATDDNYAKITSVSMASILANKKEDTKICFFILIDKKFNEKNKKLLTQLVVKYNSHIEFIQMDNFFESITMKIPHITYHTFYRLLLPKVLHFLDKLIYIDGDTIVNGDIKQLYDININDYYVAGVIAPIFVNKKHQERLKINVENYINAGVLLINNKLLIQDNLMPKFLDQINHNYDCQDQDIINIVCREKIKVIPLINNLMSKYFNNYQKFTQQGRYSIEEFESAMKHPFIIHFADKTKPWIDKKCPLASYWWTTARKTPYYSGFIQRVLSIINKINVYLFFPLNLIRRHRLNKLVIANSVLLSLRTMRIDIKNFGKEENSVFIKGDTITCSTPSWFKNSEGSGVVLTSFKMKQKFSIKVIKNGRMKLIFHASRIVKGTKNYPIWIDYKSIKINGKEILSTPVATWHDKPYRYEMPVKDGQEITLEVEQQYHQYTEDELRNILLKLNYNSEYVVLNIDEIIKELRKQLPIIDEETTDLLDSIRQNQAKTLDIFNEIKTHNALLEKKTVELEKQFSLLQKQIKEYIK